MAISSGSRAEEPGSWATVAKQDDLRLQTAFERVDQALEVGLCFGDFDLCHEPVRSLGKGDPSERPTLEPTGSAGIAALVNRFPSPLAGEGGGELGD